MRSGKLLKRPFLDLRDLVRYGDEQGLLSIAFDPKYAKNRRFYLYYVDNGGNISVDGLRRERGSKTRAAAGSRRNVISIAHPQFDNHNGGQLQFGPDGHLYLGIGDGGGAGDPDGNAQNTHQLLGKLLRIDPTRKGGHSSPPINPYASGGGATRSTRSACATRSGSHSTARPATCGSATSARTISRRSTTRPSAARATPTSGGI